jgi:biotin carboxyl carrier protein
MMQQPIQAHCQQVFSCPLPGKIVKILAREGEWVQQGQQVFVVEAMKMFYTLHAENAGKIGQIRVKEGDIVQPEMHLAQVM